MAEQECHQPVVQDLMLMERGARYLKSTKEMPVRTHTVFVSKAPQLEFAHNHVLHLVDILFAPADLEINAAAVVSRCTRVGHWTPLPVTVTLLHVGVRPHSPATLAEPALPQDAQRPPRRRLQRRQSFRDTFHTRFGSVLEELSLSHRLYAS